MGNSCRVFIAVILIISLFTVSVFATPTGSYDLYSTNGRNVNSFTASGNTYISNFSQHLAYIRVYLDQILAYDANIVSTLDYYLPLYLRYIVDDFSPGAGDTRSMWTLLSQAVSGITAIQSAALGIAQDVYNINTTTADIDRLAGLIHSDVDQVESQLTSIGSRLDTVNVNLQSLESINWLTSNVLSYSIDGINYYNSFSELTSSSIFVNNLYIKVNYLNQYYLSYIDLHAIFESYDYFNTDVQIKFYVNNIENYPDYYYNTSYRNLRLFIYPYSSFTSLDTIIKISFNKINIGPSSYCNFRYLNFDSQDFYTVDNFIQSHRNISDHTLEDIKNILINIDNNSDFIQNNNDLQINVDIDSTDGQGITAIILKLQDLFDTGVGLSQFLVGLNEFDNLLWFTSLETYQQVNYNPNVSGNGYQDLYD